MKTFAVGMTLLVSCAAGTICGDESSAEKFKVALYRSTGMEGVRQALADSDRFAVDAIVTLDADTLFNYDAVALGNVKGLSNPDWADALEIYARSGGSVLLHHDATGFRGWKKPLFPGVFAGIDKLRDQNAKVIVPEHVVTKGLPTAFMHAYYDHIVLKKGPDGQVLLADAEDNPLVIAGKVGDGRVIGNGMITGYAFLSPQGDQEKAPEGAEKQLLFNALEWLCETPLTHQSKSEIAKHRRHCEDALTIRKSADVAAGVARKQRAADPDQWFHPSRINEQGFVHPPIELLPGRFFLFDGNQVAVANRQKQPRTYGESVALLWQLKWAGVTDLISYTGGLLRFDYPTNVKHAAYASRGREYLKRDFNLLEHLEKACAEVGIGLWCFWHSKVDNLDKADMKRFQPFFIRNAGGEPYGYYVDFLNPELLENQKSVLDELAERYNKHGAIKGVFLDEFWHPFGVDRMEDDVEAFVAYCEKRYGEKAPEKIASKFALGSNWHDPDDVWWRRYVLWRDTHIAAFTKSLTEHANGKGFRIMTQPAFALTWDSGWFWGVGDSKRLAEASDLLWSYEGRFNYLYEDYPEDRTIFATHTNAHSGFNMASLIRGNYGSLFTMNGSWFPILYGESPRAVEVMSRIIRSNREWFGAEKLDQAAVLVNEMGLTLAFKKASMVFKGNDALVRDRLSYHVRTSMVMIENVDFFRRYKTLIAPKYALEHLSATSYAALTDYVNNGGMLILLNGKASVSQEDLTDTVDKTFELTGIQKTDAEIKSAEVVRFAEGAKTFAFPAVSVTSVSVKDPTIKTLVSSGDKPLVTMKPTGKGKVLSINFDITGLLADDATVDEAVRFVTTLESLQTEPPVAVEGKIKIISNLKKGNWIVATFLQRDVDFYEVNDIDKYPVSGKVKIDMKALGLSFDKYRVYSLARDREMFPQGKHFNTFGETWWTADILKNEGIDVVLTPDNEASLKLNYKTNDEFLNRWVLPRWDERCKTRCYEHEIIAIAPVGEPSPLGLAKITGGHQ